MPLCRLFVIQYGEAYGGSEEMSITNIIIILFALRLFNRVLFNHESNNHLSLIFA